MIAAPPPIKLLNCLPAYLWFSLSGIPPSPDSERRPLSVDDAHGYFVQRLPARRADDLVPMAPPYVLRCEFRWPLPPDVRRWPAEACYGGAHSERPHLAELLAIVTEELAAGGWLVDARRVAIDGGSRKLWCRADEKPGVKIFARSLAGPHDRGSTILPADGELPGVLHPAPWLTDADVAGGVVRPAPLSPTPARRS